MPDSKESTPGMLQKPKAQSNSALNEKVAGLFSLTAAICFLVAVRIAPVTAGITLAAAIVCITMFVVYIFIKRE